MALGKWFVLPRGEYCCQQCGQDMYGGDGAYETATAYYCDKACADEAESHNDGVMPLARFDGEGE